MWFYAIVAVVVLAWVAWWLRHPHHHRTGGGRYRDGHFEGAHDLDTNVVPDEHAPTRHPLGEYDGD